ncbi:MULTISPECIES: hypothetical protein [Aeromonas]|uniref:hypothetical protein n=1 Tax=Aeromonas TaxID=642 RepID=UPI0023DDEAF0|nr:MULTISPECIES: hypothetical protein [Aeromonas]MDF2390052.1 hypothetical protein [Aeromonas sp. 2MA4]MDR7018760.1 hypothetical protein [Aeromonas salmonicida]
MLKITLTLLLIMITIYWIGEKVRKNKKIDAFITALEENYSKLNNHLEDSSIINGLRYLRRAYGWLSILIFASLFILQRLSQPNSANYQPIFWLFVFAFMGWFSIKWVVDHKKTVTEFVRDNLLIVFGPLIMGVFDLVFNTPLTRILFTIVKDIAVVFNIQTAEISNPLAIGGTISLVLIAFFSIYYLVTWAVTAPVFLVSVFAVLLPIQFARFLARIDRSNTFLWFTICLMIIITLWLSQL